MKLIPFDVSLEQGYPLQGLSAHVRLVTGLVVGIIVGITEVDATAVDENSELLVAVISSDET